MRKGDRVSGERRIENACAMLNHHAADRRGRFYLCGCFRSFRLQGSVMHPCIAKGRRAYKLRPKNK